MIPNPVRCKDEMSELARTPPMDEKREVVDDLRKRLQRMLDEPAWPFFYMRKDEAALCVAALSVMPPDRSKRLLKQALEAIESGRSEPLFIMRDAIRNYLDDGKEGE